MPSVAASVSLQSPIMDAFNGYKIAIYRIWSNRVKRLAKRMPLLFCSTAHKENQRFSCGQETKKHRNLRFLVSEMEHFFESLISCSRNKKIHDFLFKKFPISLNVPFL